jgi:hypothetical protein
VATEQIPLLFFKPAPHTDPLTVAETLLAAPESARVVALDPATVLQSLRSTRGFARLEVALPHFSLDNPRSQAALEGTASPIHLSVRFYGDFEKLAEPLFRAMVAQGLVCFSVWDRTLITDWPKWTELKTDAGFATRMQRVLEHETQRLRDIEPDPARRTRLLDAFVKSPQFREAMARQARLETPPGRRTSKTYADHVNCYVCWRDGHASAAELAALRKLDPAFAAMSIADLRRRIGDLPRLLLLTAALPHQANALRDAALRHGLAVEVEPP